MWNESKCHLGERCCRKIFPIGSENTSVIEVVGRLEGNHDQNSRVYGIGGVAPCLSTMQGGGQEPKIIQAVLTPDREEKRQSGRRFKEPGEPMFTLTSQDRHGVMCINTKDENGKQPPQQDRVYDTDGVMTTLSAELAGRFNIAQGYRIRKLTPLECMRLQSFPDWWYYKCKEHDISDSQLYKMAGNAVTSAVAYQIAKRL